MKGSDQICCTSVSYSKSLNRPYHKCNVCGKDIGNPNIDCTKISMEHVKKLFKDRQVNELKVIDQKNVYSISLIMLWS